MQAVHLQRIEHKISLEPLQSTHSLSLRLWMGIQNKVIVGALLCLVWNAEMRKIAKCTGITCGEAGGGML